MSLLIKSLTCQICTLNEINVFFFHASFTLKIGLNLGCCIHVFSKQDSFFIIFKWIGAFRAKFIWFFTLSVIPIFLIPFILRHQFMKVFKESVKYLFPLFFAFLGKVLGSIVVEVFLLFFSLVSFLLRFYNLHFLWLKCTIL